MDDAKSQLIQKLKTANNVLVTVSTNPTVDQLAACIGITLWLNKANKHATAVFSGDIPNALEFLQPEATLEKTTDSLRDFIIALDKSKADKLRTKVEDRVVKIFITPYRTSLSTDDLEFSQGDFNVDAIVALGVTNQDDLDKAIVAHGHILHYATIATVNLTPEGGLGSINWHDPSASSLSELGYELCKEIDADKLDPQIATALLTGVVAETNRFSNNKTTPQTMSIAAALMKAGANQQLVANKLDESIRSGELNVNRPAEANGIDGNPQDESSPKSGAPEGTLEIPHEEENSEENLAEQNNAQAPEGEAGFQAEASSPPESPDPDAAVASQVQQLITEPPEFTSEFTANAVPEDEINEPLANPMSLPPVDVSPHIEEVPSSGPQVQPPSGPPATSDNYAPPGVSDGQTLSEIEQAVDSPHLIKDLRDKVDNAFNPAEFEVYEHNKDEDNDPNGPPKVPPPIVPPSYLPPSPPQIL
jgi:nanoRNase/pAp phosphatase (c-di-AMP/oligoRNAs hydrolase)